MTGVDPVTAVRDLFEALLAGHAVVSESDRAAADRLLTGLGVALIGQIPMFRLALGGDPVELGLEPYATTEIRGGTVSLYRPGGAR